ncbi:MAG: GNAT family acetyltransferase [Acidobacteria bacterium]|nr:GNAT family acetyltransferase [Acidobacteriota bacterium]
MCVFIDVADPRYMGDGNQYRYSFLDSESLMEFAKHKDNGLSLSFVHEALEKGDECYGILDGNSMASYGWYSNKPTLVTFGPAENDRESLWLQFAADYIYMYNGYTPKNYRGQRLHAIGMTRALKDYLDRGYKGLVSYVESNNFASLNSCYRMGYKDLGKIYILRIFGKHFIAHSKSCSQYEFRLVTYARTENGIERHCSPQAR